MSSLDAPALDAQAHAPTAVDAVHMPDATPHWATRVRALHWLVFATVATAVCAVLARDWVDDGGLGKALMRVHTQAGVLVLAFALFRIVSRLAARAPQTHDRRALAGRAAALIHLFFYLALIALPLLGWGYLNAKGKPVLLFGLELPRIVGRDRDLAETLQSLHTTLAWVFLAIVGLHVLGALWHHFMAKDDVLRSMLRPRKTPAPATSLPTPPVDEVIE